jgi:hypothetical protein
MDPQRRRASSGLGRTQKAGSPNDSQGAGARDEKEKPSNPDGRRAADGRSARLRLDLARRYRAMEREPARRSAGRDRRRAVLYRRQPDGLPDRARGADRRCGDRPRRVGGTAPGPAGGGGPIHLERPVSRGPAARFRGKRYGSRRGEGIEKLPPRETPGRPHGARYRRSPVADRDEPAEKRRGGGPVSGRLPSGSPRRLSGGARVVRPLSGGQAAT